MKSTLSLTVLALVLLQGATGCSYSEDREVYESTYMAPKTAIARYRPSNETAWSYPIPPQHILVVERDTESGEIEAFTSSKAIPTKLTYELYPIDASPSLWRRDHYSGTPIDSGTITLNGGAVIMASTIDAPIDPASIPDERSIEEIEKDLPEPDAPAEGAE